MGTWILAILVVICADKIIQQLHNIYLLLNRIDENIRKQSELQRVINIGKNSGY